VCGKLWFQAYWKKTAQQKSLRLGNWRRAGRGERTEVTTRAAGESLDLLSVERPRVSTPPPVYVSPPDYVPPPQYGHPPENV
jgi:hypothetical protein